MVSSKYVVVALTLGSASVVGCGVEAQGEPDGSRRVVFSGPEVEARLDADPGTRLTIDLREDVIYEFDQSEQPVDLSAFELQRPTRTPPVDFLSWAADNDPSYGESELFSAERFTVARGDVARDPTADDEFRAGPLLCPTDDFCWWSPGPGECYFLCAY